jgi:gamma-glutamyltranspeptidase/glutathione hydrolase
METFDLKRMGRDSTAFWHTFVEAKKLVYEDRARFVADPDFYKGSKASVDGLLSKDYARERAKLIDPARASARIEAGHPGLGASDTTYLAVADADGNMVSLILELLRLRIGLRARGLGLRDPEPRRAVRPQARPAHLARAG